MADILIRGVEMPEYCYECPCHNGENGYCQAYKSGYLYSIERPAKCPLVPLQEGHGRLIDADALLKQIRDGFEKAEQWRDAVENDPEIRPRAEATVVAFWECGAKVKMAPTIVPVEGGINRGRL